jgi:hypothetical protein
MEASEVPVLFLAFNRPDTTARVMEAIRAARPQRLYIAADGPRDGQSREAERCAEVRGLATRVDWPCKVRTLFRQSNLGCRQAVSSAITWFFDQESEGIILEDDCLPSKSFFPYCAELLTRFRDDQRIMCITGNNFQRDMNGYPYSYYFSKYNHIWGWATWRRAWLCYDDTMNLYPKFVDYNSFKALSSSCEFLDYWKGELDKVYQRTLDTWDYVWMFSCWANSGLTCTPRVNLVSNIGFGDDATHCLASNSNCSNLSRFDIEIPLMHPPLIVSNTDADAYVTENIFNISHSRGSRRSAALNTIKSGIRRSLNLIGMSQTGRYRPLT